MFDLVGACLAVGTIGLGTLVSGLLVLSSMFKGELKDEFTI